MACHNQFDIKDNGFKSKKKQFFFLITCKFLMDYFDQSSSDNLYIELLTYKTFLLTIKIILFVLKEQ